MVKATDFRHFGVIGAGAWGTALAQRLCLSGHRVTLWGRKAALVDALNATHENKTYLPGVALDPALRATTDLAALTACDAWLLVTPAQYSRAIVEQLAALDGPHTQPLVLCAKGIEQGTLLLPSAMIAPLLPTHPLAVLSGPTFAAEVARGLPTATCLACADQALGAALVQALSAPTFRPYLSADLIGAQVGGAVKNVLAIACGIVTGRALGDNARAALIARGLAEITRLAVALGGLRETVMGLSGLGDLVLTCSSTQSRNMSLGVALGQGQRLGAILAARQTVAEGVFSAAATHQLAQRLAIEMPLTAAVHALVNQGADLDTTIDALLARPLKFEEI